MRMAPIGYPTLVVTEADVSKADSDALADKITGVTRGRVI